MIDFYSRLDQVPWVFVDLETSGVDPSRCRVIELAAARYEGNGATGRRLVGSLNVLINPQIPIDDYSDFHRRQGITNALLKQASPWSFYAGALAQLLEGAVFIAHNAQFDVRFLRLEQGRACLPNPIQATLCTLELAKRVLGKTGVGHSLGALKDLYSLKANGQLHRAWHDIEVTFQLFTEYLASRLFDAEMNVYDAVHYSRTCQLSPGLALLGDD